MAQTSSQGFHSSLEAELPGTNSAFVSLQDLGSDLAWQEAVADAWGIPSPARRPLKTTIFSQLVTLSHKFTARSITAIRAVSSNHAA
jgi:hypothetical protein